MYILYQYMLDLLFYRWMALLSLLLEKSLYQPHSTLLVKELNGLSMTDAKGNEYIINCTAVVLPYKCPACCVSVCLCVMLYINFDTDINYI